MKKSITVKKQFLAKPSDIYRAWLDSKLHSAMTGGEAICSAETGGKFTTWDGYISGKNVSLKENEEIVQLWRTTDFADDDDFSKLTVRLSETERGCQLTLVHEDIPKGQPDYEQGWEDFYFEPMRAYFKGK